MADLHWSTATPLYRKETGEFTEVIAQKFRVPLEFSAKHETPLFIAGDIFDRSRNFMDMWTFKELLWSVSGLSNGVEVYAVRGQHDLFHHDRQNTATSFNTIRYMFADVFSDVGGRRVAINALNMPDEIPTINIYGCGYYDDVPEPDDKDGFNILLWHKGLWKGKSPYPGATGGNVEGLSVKLADLGYKMVFAGDYHKQWDAKIGGVHFYNLGCFTRRKTNETETPRFCILYDDLSVESVHVGEDDVFLSEESEFEKDRTLLKDAFSDALSKSHEGSLTIFEVLDSIITLGKCNDLELSNTQLDMLKDVRAAGEKVE